MKISATLGLTEIMDVELRILRRTPITSKEFDALSIANAEARQKYMIEKIADMQEVWTVFDGSELAVFTSSKNDVVHAWPTREFAQEFFSPSIIDPRTIPIPVNDWIDVILFGQQGRAIDVAYFPIGKNKAVIMTSREAFVALLLEQWFARFGNHPEFDTNNPQGSITRLIDSSLKRSMGATPKGRLP